MTIRILLFLFLISFLILPFEAVFSQSSSMLPEVQITKIQRAPLETSDLIVLDLSITNNGKKPLTVYSSNIALFDSKERIFNHVSSIDLSNQDEVSVFDISCEIILYDEIQPGITVKIPDLCFQVPQERNLKYGLIIAESDYEYCTSSNPYLKNECTVLSLGMIPLTAQEADKVTSSDDGGCLIATAAYGTELAPEVQNLREIRNKMYETKMGGEVMKSINDFYYSFSPTVSDWERQNVVFKEFIKLAITPSMSSFTILDHKSIDSEIGLIGYVLSVTFLNIGMYFVAPVMVIVGIKKKF